MKYARTNVVGGSVWTARWKIAMLGFSSAPPRRTRGTAWLTHRAAGGIVLTTVNSCMPDSAWPARMVGRWMGRRDYGARLQQSKTI